MQQIIELLNEQLDVLNRLCSQADVRNESVSKWSVGQHIEHSLISMSAMTLALKKEHPGTGKRDGNQYREMVLEHKSFPRGVVKAPEASHPSEHPSTDHLSKLILKTRNRLGNPLDIASGSTLIHPIMSVMYRDEALEFMTIHTAHHLSIINDILESQAR